MTSSLRSSFALSGILALAVLVPACECAVSADPGRLDAGDVGPVGDTGPMMRDANVDANSDANRTDAGKTVHRRFTEVWVWRDGGWQKVVRHASNITAQ